MPEFVYTTPQLDKIRKALEIGENDEDDEDDEDQGLISEALGRVQFAVRQALEAINEFRSLSVDSDVHREYLKLGPPIDKILNVLKHRDSQNTLLEHLPGLDQQLKTLRGMVERDQRSRGGQTSTEYQTGRWLIRELASVFSEVTGIKPTAKAKERFDPSDEGGDPPAPTAFEQFLNACLEPTGLEFSDHMIRQGIKAFQIRNRARQSKT